MPFFHANAATVSNSVSAVRRLLLTQPSVKSSSHARNVSGVLPNCVVESFPDVLSVHDACGRFMYLVGEVERVFGRPAEALEQRNLFDLVHPDDVCAISARWFAQFNAHSNMTIRHRIRMHQGYRWVESRGRLGAQGECVVVTTRDVHDDVEQQLQLERDASYDPLTNVLNRRAWEQRLQAEWQRSERNRQPLSLAVLDVDNFKLVNDRHGHHAGDVLLRDLIAIVDSHKRTYDLLGRLGGDEFVLLLPQTDINEAEQVLCRILECLNQQLPGVCVSFGFSSSSVARSTDELLVGADAAMYRSKRLGGNRVARYFEDQQDYPDEK